jgi:hypothetical protein
MSTARARAKRAILWWSLVEYLLVLAPFLLAARVSIWIMAKPMATLPSGVALPGTCPAFRFQHGVYQCEPWGTTQAHPWAFVAAVGAMLLCWALASWIHLSGRSGTQSFFQRVEQAIRSRLAAR